MTESNHQQKHLDNQWIGTKNVSCPTIIYETASHGLNKSEKKIMITHKKHPYNKVARIQTAGEVLWLEKSTPTYFRTAQANLA